MSDQGTTTEDARRKIREILDGLHAGWHTDGRTAAARERFVSIKVTGSVK